MLTRRIEHADLISRFRGTNVAVTGASGLIGGALARTFADAGIAVSALDVREPANWKCSLPVAKVDIRQREALTEAVAGSDYVFHEAGSKVPASDRDPATAIDVLVQGTLNVASACVGTGAKLVFASTGAIYGDGQSSLIDEGQHLHCESFYSAGKAACEHVLQAALHRWNLKYVSLRYFSVYGPGMVVDGPDAEVLGRWIRQILDSQRPVVYGDGKQLRDFTHVADVTQANLRAALFGADGDAYNVGTGTGISLNDAAALLMRIARSDGAPDVRPHYPGGNVRSVPNIEKARRDLGYRPAVDRVDGFTDLFDWIRG